jgi:hypothetical protein
MTDFHMHSYHTRQSTKTMATELLWLLEPALLEESYAITSKNANLKYIPGSC